MRNLGLGLGLGLRLGLASEQQAMEQRGWSVGGVVRGTEPA